MEYCIIGIESVSYTNKQNRPVEGFRVHLTYEKKGCDGLAVETVFLNTALGYPLSIGQSIKLYYNKYGRIEEVSVVGE